MKTRLRLIGPVMVVTLVVGALLATSCSEPGKSGTSAPAASGPAKPQGKITIAQDWHGGTLFETAGINLKNGNTYQTLASPVFDSLIMPSVDGKRVPGLAERFEISKDGLTHTFWIRKGVKFQNGDDLTGADVKFTMESFIAPDTIATESKDWQQKVARVELKDDYTVAIQMKTPQFDFLLGVDNFAGQLAVFPKKYIEAKGYEYFMKNPVGSGPWKVLTWEPNNIIELEAVENHWRKTPTIKNVTIRNIKEEATKVAMLKTGELDIATVSADSAVALRTAGIPTYGHNGGAEWFIWPLYDISNPASSPLGNLNVRKAMSFAIDRKELGDKFFGGFARPGYLFFAPRTGYFFDPNTMKPDPFDPEQSKRLLSAAGYPNGFATTLWDAGGGGEISTIVQVVGGYWQKIGITSKTEAIDRAVAVPAMQVNDPKKNNKVWIYTSAGGVFNFERFFTTCDSKRNTPKNINNPKIDDLIEAVAKTADMEEKKKLAAQAVIMCKEEFSSISIVDADTVFALSPKIDQFKPTVGMTGLGFTYENITLKK